MRGPGVMTPPIQVVSATICQHVEGGGMHTVIGEGREEDKDVLSDLCCISACGRETRPSVSTPNKMTECIASP
jgi:hypothetical protein